MYTPEEIRAAMDSAIKLRGDGDIAGAIAQGETVLAMMAVIPDQKKFGHAGAEFEYDREAINNLLDRWRQSLNREQNGKMQIVGYSFVSSRCTGGRFDGCDC